MTASHHPVVSRLFKFVFHCREMPVRGSGDSHSPTHETAIAYPAIAAHQIHVSTLNCDDVDVSRVLSSHRLRGLSSVDCAIASRVTGSHRARSAGETRLRHHQSEPSSAAASTPLVRLSPSPRLGLKHASAHQQQDKLQVGGTLGWREPAMRSIEPGHTWQGSVRIRSLLPL